MPRINEALLKNIGFKDAFFEDVKLPFKGLNSIVFAGNSYGKSSMMGLLISIIRPYHREFLQGDESDIRRKIGDYIPEHGVSHIIIEWITSDSKDISYIVTGMVLERNYKSDINQVFYSFRYSEKEKRIQKDALTYEQLPLDSPSLSIYINQIREYKKQFPHQNVTIKRGKEEWEKHLLKYHIDTHLAKMLLKMNMKEGAQAKILSFRDDHEFIKFIIDILEIYPKEDDLKEIKEAYDDLKIIPKYQVEQQFIQSLLPELNSGIYLQERYETMENKLIQNYYDWKDIETTFLIEEERLNSDLGELKELIEENNNKIKDREVKINDFEILEPFLTNKKRELVIKENEQQIENIKSRRQEITNELELLELLPEYQALSHLESECKGKEDELNKTLGPIGDRLAEIKQILFHNSSKQLESSKQKHEEFEKKEPKAKSNYEEKEKQHITNGITIQSHEKQIQKLQENIDKKVEQLKDIKHIWIEDDGPLTDFISSLEKEIEKFDLEKKEIKQKRQEIEDKIKHEEKQILNLEKQGAATKKNIEVLKEKIGNLLRKYKKIISNPIFRNYFGDFTTSITSENFDDNNYAVLDDRNQQLLREKQYFKEQEYLHAKSNYNQLKIEINHYKEKGTFPYNPFMVFILEELRKNKINGQIGWNYLNNLFRDDEERKIEYLKKIPHLLNGIIIIGTPLEQVKEFIKTIRFSSELKTSNFPIFISSVKIFEKDQNKEKNFFMFDTDSNFRLSREETDKRAKKLQEKFEKDKKHIGVLKTFFDEQKKLELVWIDFLEEYPFEEYKKLENNLISEEKTLDSLSQSKNNLEEKIKKYDNELDEYTTKQKNLQIKIDDYNIRVSTLSNFLPDYILIQKYLEDQEELRDKLPALREENDRLRLESEEFKQVYDNLIEQIRKLEGRITRIESSLRRYKVSKEEIKFDIKYLEEKITEKPITHWESDFVNLEADYNIKRDKTGIGIEIKKLKSSIENKNADIDQILSHCSINRNQIEDYYLQNINLSLIEILSTKNELNSENEKLIKNEANLSLSNTDLSSKITQSKDKYIKYNKKLLEISSAIIGDKDKIENEIKSINDQLENLKKDLELLEETNEGLKKQHDNFEYDKQFITSNYDIISPNISNLKKILEIAITSDYNGKNLMLTIEDLREIFKDIKTRYKEVIQEEVSVTSEITQFLKHIQSISKKHVFYEENEYSNFIDTMSSKDIKLISNIRESFEDRNSTLEKEINKQEERLSNITSRFVQILDNVLTNLRKLGKIKLDIPDLEKIHNKRIIRLNISKSEYTDLQSSVRQYFLQIFKSKSEFPPDLTSKKIINQIVQKHLEGRKKLIRILNIGKHQDADYILIPDAHKKSGGEKITIGILLFCSIAFYRLRYNLKLAKLKPSFTLFMDNPFGTANRLDLVKTQITLAEKLNIQLLPFSGIDDKNIYNSFPVFIPLTSDKIRGDQKLIEVDKGSKYFKINASYTAIKEALKVEKDLRDHLGIQKNVI